MFQPTGMYHRPEAPFKDLRMKKIRPLLFFLIFALTLSLVGCHTAPPSHISVLYLKDVCTLYNISWQWDSVSQVVTLRKGDKKAEVIVGSDVVILGGEKIYLSESLRRQKGAIIVPADFKSKVIDRLTEQGVSPTPAFVSKKPFKIIVDAGHGGKDPGTTGRFGTREKDVALDIARRLRDDLQRSGFAVQMTRDRDEFISLEQRTEIASNSDADLFVSVHANSSPSRNVQGVEVYTLRTLEYSEKKEEQRQKNHRLLFNHLAMEQTPSVNEILTDMLFNNKCAESPRLASYASRSICREAKADSRGVKRAGFFVLRNTLIPAILVEVGFLSNVGEERLLKTDEYRQKIADGLASSIVTYIGVR